MNRYTQVGICGNQSCKFIDSYHIKYALIIKIVIVIVPKGGYGPSTREVDDLH
jgi:hypothetical protein